MVLAHFQHVFIALTVAAAYAHKTTSLLSILWFDSGARLAIEEWVASLRAEILSRVPSQDS